MRRRHYHYGEAEFMQEPVNDAVVKVTHQNQVGWTGISLDWDGKRPYTSTTIPSQMRSDGIDGTGFLYSTPNAPRAGCGRTVVVQDGREGEGLRRGLVSRIKAPCCGGTAGRTRSGKNVTQMLPLHPYRRTPCVPVPSETQERGRFR